MENLKALIYKGDLTPYQRALAQREFEGLIERLELYEKAVKNNAVLPHVVFSEAEVCRIKEAEYKRGIEDGKVIAEHGTVNWQT